MESSANWWLIGAILASSNRRNNSGTSKKIMNLLASQPFYQIHPSNCKWQSRKKVVLNSGMLYISSICLKWKSWCFSRVPNSCFSLCLANLILLPSSNRRLVLQKWGLKLLVAPQLENKGQICELQIGTLSEFLKSWEGGMLSSALVSYIYTFRPLFSDENYN